MKRYLVWGTAILALNGCGKRDIEMQAALETATRAVQKAQDDQREAEARVAELEAEVEALKKAAPAVEAREDFGGLDAEDEALGREAVLAWFQKGTSVLGRMREIAFESDNHRARKRAKDVIGKITGQWGSQTDLVWKRSVAEAVNKDKPILVLQLFGKLDEEFC